MAKRVGIVIVSIGILLIICAVSLFVYNEIEDANAGSCSAAALEDLKAALNELPDETQTPPDTVDAVSGEVGETSAPDAFREDPSSSYLLGTNLRLVTSGGYDYIGILNIPRLKLELPVMSTWDYKRLSIAPCLYYGSPDEEHMIIAGHNYRVHFGRLSNLHKGDDVIFTDMSGRVFAYTVGDIEVIPGNATEAMIFSDWALSLYTCDYSGNNRTTIRCARK